MRMESPRTHLGRLWAEPQAAETKTRTHSRIARTHSRTAPHRTARAAAPHAHTHVHRGRNLEPHGVHDAFLLIGREQVGEVPRGQEVIHVNEELLVRNLRVGE
jgi:hypothetical protein